ncbi:MAG: DUF2332 family protein, partial [Alphaproteobacteria bacterium]|nr:DUF2332 family protein [Alphaproteobacteria bacterium]
PLPVIGYANAVVADTVAGPSTITNVSQRMAVESSFEQAAETASLDRPLAWLRMDVDRMDHEAVLEYDLWQGGAVQKTRLAVCHPHGAWADFAA